jgi:hypothetical protein
MKKRIQQKHRGQSREEMITPAPDRPKEPTITARPRNKASEAPGLKLGDGVPRPFFSDYFGPGSDFQRLEPAPAVSEKPWGTLAGKILKAIHGGDLCNKLRTLTEPQFLELAASTVLQGPSDSGGCIPQIRLAKELFEGLGLLEARDLVKAASQQAAELRRFVRDNPQQSRRIHRNIKSIRWHRYLVRLPACDPSHAVHQPGAGAEPGRSGTSSSS